MRAFCFVVVLICALTSVRGKRDPIDYTDDDINRLFEQWEVTLSEFDDIRS